MVLQLPNGPEFVLAYFALTRIGAIPVTALRSHRHSEIRHFLSASGATAYLIPGVLGNFDYREMAREVCAERPGVKVFVAGEPGPGQLDLGQMIAAPLSDDEVERQLADVKPDPAEVATMLLSGGTTSLSKLIPRTHDDYVLNARLCGRAGGFDERTVFMAILPLGHNYNLASPGMLGTFYYGGTVVLATCVGAKSASENQDFFPLTVEYRERAYAGGRIPGGYFKREGRPVEKEILTSRLIDRPVRPLFSKGFRNEVQVICLAISADQENDPDILAMNGASAALCLSGMPFEGPVGAVRVGYVDGKTTSEVDFDAVHAQRLKIFGVSNKNRTLEERAADESAYGGGIAYRPGELAIIDWYASLVLTGDSADERAVLPALDVHLQERAPLEAELVDQRMSGIVVSPVPLELVVFGLDGVVSSQVSAPEVWIDEIAMDDKPIGCAK